MTKPDINESYHTSGSDLLLEVANENKRAGLSQEELDVLLQTNQVKASRLQILLQTATSIGYAIAVLKALTSPSGTSPQSVEQAINLLTEIDLEELYD